MVGASFQALVMAAPAGSSDATIAWTDSDTQILPGSTTVTFTSQAIGSAAATRLVAVGYAVERNAGSALITAVTIGGVSATQVVQANNTVEFASIWIAAVPTGTTANIVSTHSNAPGAVGIEVWALGNASSTATDSGTDSNSNPATFDLDINAGGVALGVVIHRSNTDATFTWSNLTEDNDQVIETGGESMSGASAAFATIQTNLTISVTSSQAGVRSPVLCVASFPHL